MANWAEAERNDIDTIEDAVARVTGTPMPPGGVERHAGGLEGLFRHCDLEVLTSGVVAAPWTAADDDALIRAFTIGDAATEVASHSSLLLDAARPFRRERGGYVLNNAFRYVVGRPAAPGRRPVTHLAVHGLVWSRRIGSRWAGCAVLGRNGWVVRRMRPAA
ncbi:MAG: hypothetical protein ACRCSN_09460 [Dermatophilaceae bacterium]